MQTATKPLPDPTAANFVRLVKEFGGTAPAASGPQPRTCPFLARHSGADGDECLSTLPPGACPIQRLRWDPVGNPRIVCSQPHAVSVDWQVVEVDERQRPVGVVSDTDILAAVASAAGAA